MKRLWLTILLLSVAVVGFANSADIANLPGNSNVAMGTVPGVDMSMKYLGQLFGSVGGALQSSSHVHLLQELFGIFNKAILALALAWTGYTIITIMFSSAMEGGFITSQRKNAVFIFSRLAIGFSLLLPLSSGYSSIQVLGMRAMVEGVNLANKVWDETVYFLTYKGILHDYSDKATSNSTSTVNTYGWNSNGTAIYSPTKMSGKPTGTQALVYDMLCTAYYAAANPGSKADRGPIYVPPKENSSDQYFNFPDNHSDTGCGQYRLSDQAGFQNTTQSQIEQTMVYNMWPIAQNLVIQFGVGNNSNSAGQNIDISNAATTMSGILYNYVASTQLNIQQNTPKTSSDLTTDQSWEVQAASQGWFGAGRFYWLMSQANWDNVQNQSSSSSAPNDINWPSIASSSSNLGVNSVSLSTNSNWNGQNPLPKSVELKNSFNTSLIPATQAAINGSAAQFSSDTPGMNSYNAVGLCVDSAHIGSNMPNGDSVWNHNIDAADTHDAVPNGHNSRTYKYLLLNSITSTTLSALKGQVQMGVCGQTNPATGSTYDEPVLVKFDDSLSYGTQGLGYKHASDVVWEKLGRNYAGIRLCPKSGLASIDPSNLMNEAGYCNADLAKYAKSQNFGKGTAIDTNLSSKGTDGIPVLAQVLGAVGDKFADLEQQNTQGLTDPIYFMTQLGATMLGQAGTLWEKGADQIKTMATWQGIMSGIAPGSTIFQGYISWWEPVYVAVGGGLFVAGFMLCFYAPLYPFVLFLLGALNWLMVCVEFMVALPLVALGVTHPEGHDFLGKAEVALMLTLSACLRPVLMVLGFISGMIMSFIGFSVVNYMFSSVLTFVFGNMPMMNYTRDTSTNESHFGQTPAVIQSIFGVVTDDWTGHKSQAASKDAFSGSATTDMLLIPLLMVFYGYIVVEVVHFCFTMIHQLPDQVLRWIGGPVGQDRTQGIADKIRQGVQGAAKQAGDMQGKSTIAAGKAEGQAIGGSIGAGIQVGVGAAKMMMGG